MDVSSSRRRPRQRRRRGEVNVSGDNMDVVSRINELPDDLLVEIISRLPIFEASRTSILARRWRRIWIMNPKIQFWCITTIKDKPPDTHGTISVVTRKDKLRFVKAVDQCLELYSASPQKLKSFFMNFCFLNDYTFRIHRWIQSLDSLGVQEIFLINTFCCCKRHEKRFFTPPFQLLSGISTLRLLHLVHCQVDFCLSRQFIFLERLNLKGVRLLRDEISSILLSCPNLKSLTLLKCDMPSKLKISGPKLKLGTLRVWECEGLHELNICASNLCYVYIENNSVDLLLSSAPKLEHLTFLSYGEHKSPYPFVGVPSNLPQLRLLLLQTRTDQMPRIPQELNLFSNLRSLYLVMSAVSMVDLEKISPVLNMCPLLETYDVAVNSQTPNNETGGGEWHVLRHKHLERMELYGFSKTKHEFEFVRFILTSAEVLKWLVLRSSFREFTLFGDVDPEENVENGSAEDQAICHKLQAHAISIHAKVEMFD